MSNSDLNSYLSSIGRHPVLTKESQLRHAQRIRAWVHYPEGRESAPERVKRAGIRSMEIMIATNLRLVVSIAKKYQNRGVDLLDLIQEGNLGLIRGLELFDPTRGYQLSTYAYWWVRQAITRTIHTKARLIRVPINTLELMSKVYRVIQQEQALTGRIPSRQELAEKLGVTERRLDNVMNHVNQTQVYSLDAPTWCSDGERSSTLAEAITNPEQEDMGETVERNTQAELIHQSMEGLSEIETRVITGFFEENSTNRQLSTELGITGSRVSQLKEKALVKMRYNMKGLSVLSA